MRIFHLVPNLDYGGLQKAVELLALHQTRSGHSVTIACWAMRETNHPEALVELADAGIEVVYFRRLPDGEMLRGRRARVEKLRSYMGPGKADIVHIHNPFEYLTYGVAAARLARAKSLITVHAIVMFEHKNFGLKGRFRFWLACMLVNGVVSVCDEFKVYLAKRFRLPARKLLMVEDGIDVAPFLAVPDRIARDVIVFGTAGRMSSEKGHDDLIAAFALIYQKHPNTRLRLLGSGGQEEKLKRQAQNLGLQNVIEFCGFSRDVPAFLGTLDVYVLPSLSEAQSLGLMEAVVSGLPVVACEVGGVGKVVKSTESGWLCEPRNPESLANAMELAIANGNRPEQTARSRNLAVKLFSAKRMADEYEAVYEKLIVGA